MIGRDNRAKSEAPLIPAETCPIAEGLQTLLSALSGDLGTFREELDFSKRKTVDKADVAERLLYFDEMLASVSLKVEELRASNEGLRDCGRYWRGAAKGGADQLDACEAFLLSRSSILPDEVNEFARRLRDAS